MGGSESGCGGAMGRYGVRIGLYVCNVKHFEVVAYDKVWAKNSPTFPSLNFTVLRIIAINQFAFAINCSLRNSLTSGIVDPILPSIRVF